MKKYFIIFAFVLLLFTGCGKVELRGRYEWHPYNDNDKLYAYYDFKDDKNCVFALSLNDRYQESPQTYTYTIEKKEDHYELVLTHVTNTKNTYTIIYNSKDDTIVDKRMIEMEDIWEKEYNDPVDNDKGGIFEKK